MVTLMIQLKSQSLVIYTKLSTKLFRLALTIEIESMSGMDLLTNIMLMEEIL